MKLSDQRLDAILERLQQQRDAAGVTVEEWLNLALELKQLRLRTSPQSRAATAPARSD